MTCPSFKLGLNFIDEYSNKNSRGLNQNFILYRVHNVFSRILFSDLVLTKPDLVSDLVLILMK